MKKSIFGSITLLSSFTFILPGVVIATGQYREQVVHKNKYVDQYFEIDESGNTKLHIFLGDQKISTIENEESIYFNIDNHLDSTSIITDELGEIVEISDYDDFGSITSQSSVIFNDYKFGGKELDNETDLQYFGARYYDSSTARFVSIDPLLIDVLNANKYNKDIAVLLSNPQELNSYSYAANNPVVYTDKTGNATIGEIWNSFVSSVSSIISNIFNKPNDTNQTQASMSIANQSYAPVHDIQTQKNTTWDAISDNRIKGLDPRVQQPAIDFINNTESELGIQLRITEGYRSNERQEELYWQSRTKPPTGPWRTNARAGESYHNYGQAIDVVVMENGQPIWEPISQDIANIGIREGFRWGGSWARPDYPHFEMRLEDK